jgi:hypothetical protein
MRLRPSTYRAGAQARALASESAWLATAVCPNWLPERTRKDLTICFVFRQHKVVADVLQCNDDDGNGNS